LGIAADWTARARAKKDRTEVVFIVVEYVKR